MGFYKAQCRILRATCFFYTISMCLGHALWARMDLIPGSRFTSARGAAMGDALLPIGDDPATGLFYNPADLARIRKPMLEAFNLALFGNMGYISNLTTSNFFSIVSLPAYAPTLQAHPGVFSGMGGHYMLSFGFSGLGFGLLAQSQFGAQSDAAGVLSYRSLYQVIPAVGYGFRLFQGVCRIGYSLQWVNQALGSVTNAASGATYTQGLNQGSGFSHTIGAAIVLPMVMLPTFDVVLRNAFGTTYSARTLIPISSASVGVPANEAMSVDGSFSIQPRMGQGAALNLVLVDRDMTNISGTPLYQHLAFGAELIIKGRLYLRGGVRSTYPSAGLALRSKGAEMSLTWYTEELGTPTTAQPDSRLMFQYQIRNF